MRRGVSSIRLVTMKSQDGGGANDTLYFLEKLKFTLTEKEKHLKQRFSEIQRHASVIAAFRLSMMSGEFHRSAVIRWIYLAMCGCLCSLRYTVCVANTKCC